MPRLGEKFVLTRNSSWLWGVASTVSNAAHRV